MIDFWIMKDIEILVDALLGQNNQQDSILARLDSFLVSTEWKGCFHHLLLNFLSRDMSDHSPLVLDFGLLKVKCV